MVRSKPAVPEKSPRARGAARLSIRPARLPKQALVRARTPSTARPPTAPFAARTPSIARPKRAPKITETAEHLTIAGYLQKVGLGGTAVMFHLRNERVGYNQRAIAARMGVLSSLPDWAVIDGGRVGFIELKVRGWKKRTERTGTYTPHERAQLAMHKKLRIAGAWVEICETLDEVLDALVSYGVPLRSESLTIERLRRSFAGMAAR